MAMEKRMGLDEMADAAVGHLVACGDLARRGALEEATRRLRAQEGLVARMFALAGDGATVTDAGRAVDAALEAAERRAGVGPLGVTGPIGN